MSWEPGGSLRHYVHWNSWGIPLDCELKGYGRVFPTVLYLLSRVNVRIKQEWAVHALGLLSIQPYFWCQSHRAGMEESVSLGYRSAQLNYIMRTLTKCCEKNWVCGVGEGSVIRSLPGFSGQDRIWSRSLWDAQEHDNACVQLPVVPPASEWSWVEHRLVRMVLRKRTMDTCSYRNGRPILRDEHTR